MLGIVIQNNIEEHLPLPLVVYAHISPPESRLEVCMATLELLLGPEATSMVGVTQGLLPGQELLHMDLGPVDLGGNGVDTRQGSGAQQV